MCWTCNINKLKAQIAKEDINVYKIVNGFSIRVNITVKEINRI